MANQLTTRARALAWHRQQLLLPAPARPVHQGRRSDARRRLLALLLGCLLLAVLGAALWPDGRTRPLSYVPPQAAAPRAWQWANETD